MCDRADRYTTTFCDEDWLHGQDITTAPYRDVLDTAWNTLTWTG